MPTITVSITIAVPVDDVTNGGDFAADLVAHVLTHYSDPTITIDHAAAAPAATRLPSWMTSTTVHPVVDTIVDHEVATHAATKQARHLEDDRTYDITRINVPCPKCSAAAGDPCSNGKGKPYSRPFLHIDRRSAWQQLSVQPPTAARAATGRPDWMPTVITLDEV